VLDGMKIQNDFWFNYPIFLPDYELFNQLPEQLQQETHEDLNRTSVS
jgi:hypothetical protein